jgi:hypothetical protein
VNWLFRSAAARSNSVFTNSAFAPASADLDGVADRLDGIVALLLARAHEPDGAFVVHDEPVDREAIADDADVRLPEWSCSFHVD